jgi:hypothetical protein
VVGALDVAAPVAAVVAGAALVAGAAVVALLAVVPEVLLLELPQALNTSAPVATTTDSPPTAEWTRLMDLLPCSSMTMRPAITRLNQLTNCHKWHLYPPRVPATGR